MDEVSDDIFHHILSYLSSRQDLANLALMNARAFAFIHHDQKVNSLFKDFWYDQFGYKGDRQSYRSLYYIKKLVRNAPISLNRTRKAGLLTPVQEHAALLYDNGEGAASLGYFGMDLLWEHGPVAIWGDFPGVRVFCRGVQGVISDLKRSVVSIGEDESHVLTLLSCPEKTSIFLGFSTGKVVCINTTFVGNDQYHFSCVSSSNFHTNEVTSLSFLPSGDLISTSVDGHVYRYPNVMVDGSLEEAFSICHVESPILTCCTIYYAGRTFLVTGDQSAYVTLWWEFEEKEWRHTYCRLDSQGVPTQSLLWCDNKDLYVLIGDNDGKIHTWKVDDLFELEMMGVIDVLNGWSVECLRVCGNIMLIGSGRKTVIFSLPDVRHSVPKLIGSLRCHPNTQRFASVVSCFLCHSRQSLVTLCRDGTLHEYSYEHEKDMFKSNKKRGRPKGTNKIPLTIPARLLDEKSSSVDGSLSMARKDIEFISNADESDRETDAACNFQTSEVPQTVDVGSYDTMFDFITNETLLNKTAMKVRLIQAAVQHARHGMKSFIGIDYRLYANIPDLFDSFADFKPCSRCTSSYTCLFEFGHAEAINGVAKHEKLLIRLIRSSTSTQKIKNLNGWVCDKCQTTCNPQKRRCFFCYRWKDGIRPPKEMK
jgi:WD40 repeat protein